MAALAAPPLSAADCGFSAICPYDPPLCDAGCALESDVDALASRLAASRSAAVADDLAPLNERYRALNESAKSFQFTRNLNTAESPLSCLRQKLNDLSLAVLPSRIEELSRALDRLRQRAEALQNSINSPGAAAKDRPEPRRELSAIDKEGSGLWRRVHETSLNVADMGDWTSTIKNETIVDMSPNAALLSHVNPLQERLAALSILLRRMDMRLGPPPDASAAAAKRQAVIDSIRDCFPNKSTLLDMPHAAPPPAVVAPPPSQDGPKLLAALFGPGCDYDSVSGEVDRILAMHEKGCAQTVGDPAGRTRLCFFQEGKTCSIACEAEVLLGLQAAPPDVTPQELESFLYDKAARLGCFTGAAADPKRRHAGGTPRQYSGGLLGLPVRKRYLATVAELDAAVKRGGMIIAVLDAGLLWNQKKWLNTGHAIVITGAEIDAETKDILGYYINDTSKRHAGRLVAAPQFRKAWEARDRVFFEPL